MRQLGVKADAARLLASYGSLGGLKVEFSGGSKWFTSGWEPGDVSGADLRKRVTSWGEASALLEADAKDLAQAAFSVAISDHDGELRALWEDEQFQRVPCEVHWALWTPGEAEPTTAQSVRILRGTLVPPISWSDAAREMQFEVVSLAERHSTEVGFRCTRERFEHIGEDEEGRACPIVYGKPDKVRPVFLNGGARARLAEGIAADTLSFTVDDAEAFPQDESIDIRIGREVITGSFHGNLFTATARGKILVDGTCSHDSPGNCTVRDSSLSGYADNAFVGYGLEIAVDPYPYGNAIVKEGFVAQMPMHAYATLGDMPPEQLRDIIRFDASTGTIEFAAPYLIEKALTNYLTGVQIVGNEVWIKAGTAYKVRTIAERHDAGAEVAEWSGPAEYAVGLGSCAVRNVRVRGVQKLARSVTALGPIKTYGGNAASIAEWMVSQAAQPAAAVAPAWIPLPGEFWAVDVVEPGFGTYTRLTLRVPPTFMAGYEIESDELRVDLDGPGDGGEPHVNPADVIEHLYAAYGDLGTRDEVHDLDPNRLYADDAFDDAARWTPVRATVTANAEANPRDAAMTADRLVEASGTANSHHLDQGSLSCDGASRYEVSIDAKGGHGRHLVLLLSFTGFAGGPMVKYDLDAGTVYDAVNVDSSGIVDIGGGWYRCWFLVTSTAAREDQIFWIYLARASDWATVYAGDGVSYVTLSGAVYRKAEALEDYIPGRTSGATLVELVTGGFVAGELVGETAWIADGAYPATANGPAWARVTGDVAGDGGEPGDPFVILADMDFADARAALSRWKMSFARHDVVEINSFAAELAYLARCRIRWLGEVPELLYQACDGGVADLTVGRSRVILDSPVATREELERAASEVTVSWTENDKLKRHTERDAGAEAAVGRRGIDIDCWCYDGIEWPRALARFILQRTRKLHDVAQLDATAYAVGLEPGDVLAIDSDMSADWPCAPVKGLVLEAAHRQGSAPATPDAVGVRARLFRWAGCSLSCEGSCETTGCESSCESYFEPDSACWTCETSCEAACELACTTAAEGLCGDAACEVAVTTGCAVICQVTDMVGCGSCQTYCQFDCESAGCETGWEA